MENSISLYHDLLNGNQKIIIPEYQREYTWGKDDIEVFLEDIHRSIESTNDFYLGTIYVYNPIDKNEVHIIDGQQRITTLVIFLYVILEKIKDGEEADFLYLEDGMKKIYSDNEALQNAYQYSIYESQGDFEDEVKNSQIESNMKDVEEKLKKYSLTEINNIYNILTSKIKVNLVAVKDLKMAMNIFMNLNARGKELSAIEIIKSNIFSYLLDTDANSLDQKELKKRFSSLLYNTESAKYNDNLKEFKKNLYLYLSYMDIDLVTEYSLKNSTNDKVFASTFMKIILEHYDFKTFAGISDFVNQFEVFTNMYIWWNIRMIKNYEPTDLEIKYRQRYKDINKGKTTDIATLISYSKINEQPKDELNKVLEVFSIIELKKIYNKYILKMEEGKISLAPIEQDMPNIIKMLKARNRNGFLNIFNSDKYEFQESKILELVEYIENNRGTHKDKEIEIIRNSLNNLKGSELLI